MKALSTILLLIMSNTFMTFAWYGHLKFSQIKGFEKLSLPIVILISWGIALFEYCFQVPANRIGFQVPANRIGFSGNGGAFSLMQLKVMQEVITLTIFTIFTVVFFKTETLRLNHFIGFLCLILAVFFIFKK